MAFGGLSLIAFSASGDDSEFWRTLEKPVSLLQRDAPLRPALLRIGQIHRIGVMLDRRLDPNQKISMQIQEIPLGHALQSLVTKQSWGISYLPPIVYIGPRETTVELATHVARQRQLIGSVISAQQRRAWRRRRQVQWHHLAEPRQLIAEWMAPFQRTVPGLELIPHDLWSEHSLPPVDLLLRLTVVLAGFDLAPEIQPNGKLRVVQLPKNQVIERRYPIASRLRSHQPFDFTHIREQFSNSSFTMSPLADRQPQSSSVVVVGPWEAHRMAQATIEGRFAPSERRPARTNRQHRLEQFSRKRFTLTVKNQTVEAILESVASQLDLHLKWQIKSAERVRRHRVSFSVNNVPLSRLLADILREVPATYELRLGLPQPQLIIRELPDRPER